jgi:acyl-coenzyme A thioesterase PaaI-like protein
MTFSTAPLTLTFRTRLEGTALADLTGLVERALLDLALQGAGGTIASLASDVASPAQIGDPVTVSATVDRATRTLVFARADIRRESDNSLLLAAQAVLKAPIR